MRDNVKNDGGDEMGQYFVLVNLDKREFIHPHEFGTGAKLWEICRNNIAGVLPFLLRQSNEGGGGDIQKNYKNAGRWAGNRIVVVGDYDKSGLYDRAKEEFKEISKEVKKEFIDFIEH
jgi:hypothetical protein